MITITETEILRALESGMSPPSDLQDIIQDMIEVGIIHKANAVIYAAEINSALFLTLCVGSTILMGPEVKTWLWEYHNFNQKSFDAYLIWMAEYLREEMNDQNACMVIVKSPSDKKWKNSFKLIGDRLQNIDQIRKRSCLT